MKNGTSANELMTTLLLASQAGVVDEEAKDIIKVFLREQVAQLQGQKAAKEAHLKSQLETAKQIEAKKLYLRKACPHSDPAKGTRLRGQWLPNRQLFLVCSRCFSEFHNPPKVELGQAGAPQHLLPSDEYVGGPMSAVTAGG